MTSRTNIFRNKESEWEWQGACRSSPAPAGRSPGSNPARVRRERLPALLLRRLLQGGEAPELKTVAGRDLFTAQYSKCTSDLKQNEFGNLDNIH